MEPIAGETVREINGLEPVIVRHRSELLPGSGREVDFIEYDFSAIPFSRVKEVYPSGWWYGLFKSLPPHPFTRVIPPADIPRRTTEPEE